MDAPLLTDDFKEFLRLLNANLVEYLLVGGYAVGLHGYPRATVDLDVWVRATPDNAERIVLAMRLFAVSVAVAGFVAMTACDGANKGGGDYARPLPAPTAVNCADAAQLRQRGLDDRRLSDETSSDQEKIVSGNRATETPRSQHSARG